MHAATLVNRGKGKGRGRGGGSEKERGGKDTKGGQKKDFSKVICYNCNKAGHKTYHCPILLTEETKIKIEGDKAKYILKQKALQTGEQTQTPPAPAKPPAKQAPKKMAAPGGFVGLARVEDFMGHGTYRFEGEAVNTLPHNLSPLSISPLTLSPSLFPHSCPYPPHSLNLPDLDRDDLFQIIGVRTQGTDTFMGGWEEEENTPPNVCPTPPVTLSISPQTPPDTPLIIPCEEMDQILSLEPTKDVHAVLRINYAHMEHKTTHGMQNHVMEL